MDAARRRAPVAVGRGLQALPRPGLRGHAALVPAARAPRGDAAHRALPLPRLRVRAHAALLCRVGGRCPAHVGPPGLWLPRRGQRQGPGPARLGAPPLLPHRALHADSPRRHLLQPARPHPRPPVPGPARRARRLRLRAWQLPATPPRGQRHHRRALVRASPPRHGARPAPQRARALARGRARGRGASRAPGGGLGHGPRQVVHLVHHPLLRAPRRACGLTPRPSLRPRRRDPRQPLPRPVPRTARGAPARAPAAHQVPTRPAGRAPRAPPRRARCMVRQTRGRVRGPRGRLGARREHQAHVRHPGPRAPRPPRRSRRGNDGEDSARLRGRLCLPVHAPRVEHGPVRH
mmetsp:Transcript_1657/g.5167  ORF Transcript_1657/g.5167 Transcript_1657/m.5167 type:complete len:348 (+) Transcript_1657:1368-2411(+)